MANQQWVSLINSGSARAAGAGTALTSSASTATISPCQAGGLNTDVASVNPDGQYLGWYSGMLIRVTARGYVNTAGTTSNLSWLLRCNAGNTGTWTTFATTTTLALGTGSITGLQWELDALMRCTALGSGTSGSVSTQGSVKIPMAVPGAPVALGTGNAIILPMPNISGETALGINTTSLTGIGLAATSSAAFGTIACTEWLVETLD
jgi:hypothetical protein